MLTRQQAISGRWIERRRAAGLSGGQFDGSAVSVLAGEEA